MKIIYLLFIFIVVACANPTKPKQVENTKRIRIVSLAPSVSKELESLNLGGNIVGATSYCDISQRNKELVVGSVTEANEEKIVLLQPDIIFATSLTRQSTIDMLRKMGIAVHVISKANSYEQICEQFIELGKMVDKEQLAINIVNKSKAKLDSIRNTIPAQTNKRKVFFQIGAKPLFTVVPNTFMDDYITFAGCENIASDLQNGTISRESILLRNPDIIFIVTMGIVGQDEEKVWRTYTNLNAVKNNRIFTIDSNKASTPTVESFTETLEQIIKYIYN